MSFNQKQIDALNAPLNRANVKQRAQAGRKLSYLEGWKAIEEANRIFGFSEWSSQTVEIRCVSEAARKIGQQQKDGHSVSYIARVRVEVMTEGGVVIREGVGAGHGIDADLGLAHESAIKESETDARKRALMTFGNPFGLALYDKDQANVADVRERVPARQSDPHINEDTTEEDGPSWSQMASESMIEALSKRAGPAAVETFLAKEAIKRDLGLMDMDDHTRVMRVAAERRAIVVAQAERAA